MAVGFAALAGAIRESTAKKPLAGGQLGNTRAKVALSGGEFGADQRVGHILYHILYKTRKESKGKNAIRICSLIEPSLKQQWNQMFWRIKNVGPGIAETTTTTSTTSWSSMASEERRDGDCD